MDWIKSRIVEPTTWCAIGIGALLVSMLMPEVSFYLMILAGVTVAAGVLMRERGEG